MLELVVIDYETFWSANHSLSKINPITYVMHPDTEIQSLAIAVGDSPIEVVFGEEEIRKCLCSIDWTNKYHVSHNALFDACISRWRFGVQPKMWGCTLAMSRPFYAVTVGGSLAKVAAAEGLGEKGSLDAVNTKGKRLAEFTPEEIDKMRVYNKQDTHLCREIFNRLAPRLGKEELQLIDLCVRMTVEPQLEADIELLRDALEKETARKRDKLEELRQLLQCESIDAMRKQVMSQLKFVALLSDLGAIVPMKESQTTGKWIPALAKTDKGMTDLLDHYDERVALAAAVRLEVKTTQLETRLQTYLKVAEACDGKLPMPVNYCGADASWRMSGAMKMNVQNNVRVDPKDHKPTDALRQSIRVPEGKLVLTVDSSNIELRVAHLLAGQMDTIEKIRKADAAKAVGEPYQDLYCWFASMQYGRPITEADKLERYLGKQAMLQLQFGASAISFQNKARVNSKGKVALNYTEAEGVVRMWRNRFQAIAAWDGGAWMQCNAMIEAMYEGNIVYFGGHTLVKPLFTAKERVITPNGHWLHYPDLRWESGEWVYGQGRNKAKLYGPKLFGHCVQHLARLIVMEQTLKLDRKYAVSLSCHDEAVCVVEEEQAEEAKAFALHCFTTPPAWWPELPLACTVGIGSTYGAAK